MATIYIAEARALRALYYFELVRRWGNIPLMTSTAMSNQHPSTFVQADPVDVYKFIEDDLLYACDICHMLQIRTTAAIKITVSPKELHWVC